MAGSRALVGYVVSLLFIPASVIFLFHRHFVFFSELDYLSFYISVSALFFFALFLLLCWYYSFLLVRKNSLSSINLFLKNILQVDSNKLSEEDALIIEKENLNILEKKEKAQMIIYSCSIPMLLVFLTTSVSAIAMDRTNTKILILAALTIYVLVFFFFKIKSFFNLKKHYSWIKLHSEVFISIYKGIQYYDGYDYVIGKFDDFEEGTILQEKYSVRKIFFKSFSCLCFAFVAFCGMYILVKDLFSEFSSNLLDSSDLLFASYLSLILALSSFWKYFEASNFKIETLESRTIANRNSIETKKLENDIFIAFHDVCFQDPTKVSDTPLIQNLSFSVLPGEVVAITGEDAKTCGTYMFDLILKYYKPQSGAIYLAGAKSELIDRSSIKNNISIFRFDFCLVPGTVFDNLEIVLGQANPKKVEHIATKVGLLDSLDCPVFDENGKFYINQEMMIRIQIARTYMKKPKIVLIETPEYFENEVARDLFEQFVKNISQRKTIMMITDDIKKLVYSDKILYFGKGVSHFGIPAELSKTKEYAAYLKLLSEESEYEY